MMRKHQLHAINAIADNVRCVVNHFCGTGKTHIMTALLGTMQIGEVAVLVFPSLALIHQFHAAYASQLPQFQWMTVCSAEQKLEFFLPHTTDLDVVSDFLDLETSRVLTVTYDSLPIMLSAMQNRTVRYLIFDEAHHVTERRNRKLLWKQDVWQVSAAQQTIFFTASLRNKSGIVMDPEQLSRMENAWNKYGVLKKEECKDSEMEESHCGPVVSRYTHREAVNDGVCNDFALRCDFGITRDGVSREQIVLESILRAMITNNQSRALTFHASIVKGVSLFTGDLLLAAWEHLGKPSGFAIPEIIHLSASTPNRDLLLAKFEAVPDHGIGVKQLVILSSCRTIGEGIDTKRAQLVAFADPKKSQIDILQNIGRVCRAYENMQPATVLIPVIVNKAKYLEVQDDETKRDALIREDLGKHGDFNAILRVSSALRQLDPDLYSLCWSYPNAFSPVEVRDNLVRQGCSIVKDSHLNQVLSKYQGVPDAMFDFSQKSGRSVEVHSTSMGKPTQYFGTRNDDPIVVVHDEKESKYELLERNNKNTLNPPKRRSVQVHVDPEAMILWHSTDALEFVAKNTQTVTLSAEIKRVSWETRLASFQQFLSEKGKYPSLYSKDLSEKTIGYWVCTQRTKQETMSDHRKMKLDAIDFIWEVYDWEAKLKECFAWISRNGKYPSQKSSEIDERTLASWIQTQRRDKHIMSPNRKDILNKANFVWKVDYWPTHFESFVKWLSKNQKYPSTGGSSSISEKKLGRWIQKQRRQKSKISDDRKKQLNDIGFVWDDWESHFDEFVRWIADHKTYPRQSGARGREQFLGHWVRGQRLRHESMIIERKEKLDLIGFVWKEDPWTIKFDLFIMWISKNKIYPSNGKTKEEKVLFKWVHHQRASKDSMSADRKTKLESVGFVWKTEKWLKNFEELVQWLSKDGRKYPSRSSKDSVEKAIADWVSRQRTNKSTMTADRKENLEKIKFVWGDPKKHSICGDQGEANIGFDNAVISISNHQDDLSTSTKDSLKRKEPQLDEIPKKKQRSFASQLESEFKKLAKKQQIITEAARLEALQNRSEDENVQLEALKRQFLEDNDTYNESNHDTNHASWKQSMNAVFADLVAEFTINGENVLYLDASEQHTTNALRSVIGTSRKLFVANWNKETCATLKSDGMIDEVEQGSLVDLLVNQWRNESFAAAYLDLCSGSASAISDALCALLRLGHKCKLVGFTMTQRDPEGCNQVERLDRLEANLRQLCPKMLRVADLSKFQNIVWTNGGVVTRFYVLEHF